MGCWAPDVGGCCCDAPGSGAVACVGELVLALLFVDERCCWAFALLLKATDTSGVLMLFEFENNVRQHF